MGWELRLFLRPTNLTSMPWVHTSLGNQRVEERRDEYSVLDEDAGLKLRGGGGLELKICTERDDAGFEKWKKHHVRSEGEALELAKRAHPSTGVPAELKRVIVIKRRSQAALGWSCVIEQTFLQVAFEGGAEELWLTLALEGERAACADELPKMQAWAAQMAGSSAVFSGGYPGFLAWWAVHADAARELKEAQERLVAQRPPSLVSQDGEAAPHLPRLQRHSVAHRPDASVLD